MKAEMTNCMVKAAFRTEHTNKLTTSRVGFTMQHGIVHHLHEAHMVEPLFDHVVVSFPMSLILINHRYIIVLVFYSFPPYLCGLQ